VTVRYTKSEIAARKTADATLVDPSASIQAKYHAQLILKNTKKDALARAEINEQRPDVPLPSQHRVPVAPDPNAKAFMDALERMLERQGETASVEASQPEAPAASVARCATQSETETGGDICTLCLIPKGNCGHGSDQSNEVKPNE
jgi:hypothetical protein